MKSARSVIVYMIGNETPMYSAASLTVIGQNIRNHRKEKKLTQKELANLSGVAEVSIRQYENGKRQPQVEQLQKIAVALKVSLNDLIDWNEVQEAPVTLEGWKIIDAEMKELAPLAGLSSQDSGGEWLKEAFKKRYPNLREDDLKTLEEHAEFLVSKRKRTDDDASV